MNSYKKLFLVYNPRSSHYAKVREDVLEPVRQLKGWMVGKYEIKSTSFDDNVEKLSNLLTDDALVIIAGGDGTATMAMNAILVSAKDVVCTVLGYGNFNDVATMLQTDALEGSENKVQNIIQKYEAQQIEKLYPLDVKVDGEHWRYAPAYMSVGMLAEATKIMETPEVRNKLNTGKKGAGFSLRMAVKWYLKNRKKIFVPEGRLNGQDFGRKVTDYLAVNSPTVAGIMKGGDWWQDTEQFGNTVQELGRFGKMVKFGLTSVRKKIPLEVVRSGVVQFAEPGDLEIQTEGEFAHLEKVQEIEVRKDESFLKVITG